MLKDFLGVLLVPVEAFIGRIFSVAGAILLSQFPNFVQAYLQRLGGHLDEINRVIAQYSSAAKETGKTLQEYINIHLNSNSPEIVKTGQIISDHVSRSTHLKNSLDAVSNAGPFSKFFSFVSNADWTIARETLANYTPGLSFNLESVVYGLVGIIAGMLVYFLIKAPIKGIIGARELKR
jgi:CRISPR/Cas system-associated protein Csm6